MNYKVILNLLGKVSVILAALMVLPLVAALIYGEAIWWTYLATSGIALAVGLPVTLFVKPDNKAIYSREGLVVVSLAWIYASVISTVPLMLSGAIPSFVDALFEMVSGFTTTGATILSADRIDAINATMRSLHLWRAFTHWIGGMGIIVFVMAIVGGAADRSMHILRAEMPGPSVDKIVPRASTTAKILYLIYMGMTLLQIIFLVCGGMPLFDALVTSFSSAGTGGFANRSDSVASYNAFCQWVVAVFMLLYGVNFNLYFLMLVRKFRTAFSSRELWLYLGIVIFASTTVCIDVFGKLSFTMSFPDALRHSVYQVAAFITTTGSSTIPSGCTSTALRQSQMVLSSMALANCAAVMSRLSPRYSFAPGSAASMCHISVLPYCPSWASAYWSSGCTCTERSLFASIILLSTGKNSKSAQFAPHSLCLTTSASTLPSSAPPTIVQGPTGWKDNSQLSAIVGSSDTLCHSVLRFVPPQM